MPIPNDAASIRDQLKELGAEVEKLQAAHAAIEAPAPGPSIADIQHAVDGQLAPIKEQIDSIIASLNDVLHAIG